MTNKPETVAAGAAVTLTGLRKHYGEVRAVDGVDLVIAPGEVVALLGPNGAGKSTTVDMLLGLSRPDAGAVTIFGSSPGEAVADGRIGAMLQGGALLDDATVGETVGMIASLHRNPLRVGEALRRAGVEDLASRRCTKLSGGQKHRAQPPVRRHWQGRRPHPGRGRQGRRRARLALSRAEPGQPGAVWHYGGR